MRQLLLLAELHEAAAVLAELHAAAAVVSRAA
jgi:hypothetical protein